MRDFLFTMIVAAAEGELIQQELGFVILLSIAAGVAIFIRLTPLKLPYTVALVLVGLVLALLPRTLIAVPISSDFILALLVPPLLFEATLHIKYSQLRLDMVPILLVAIVGSLGGAFIIAAIVVWALGLPWAAAIAFGALISATDPVAVIAFFRSLGVSKRLALLVEGESLLNDAVALVLFLIAVGSAGAAGEFSLASTIGQFLFVAFGGLGIGIVLGAAVSFLILRNVDDHLIETTTTLALAFGSFVVAEELGVSGILAVVAAGIFVGNVGTQSTSPTTQLAIENFWELLAFVANSLVFLIIGLEIDVFEALEGGLLPIVIAVAAVLFSRALVIYSLTWFNSVVNPKRNIPLAFRHVMFWGGMRGAISLALALTLTGSVFGTAVDEQIRFMTFGVVLFTLLVQGLTIERVISAFGLSERKEYELEQQRRQALLYARREAKRELDRLHRYGLISGEIWQQMSAAYETEIEQTNRDLHQLVLQYPDLKHEMIELAQADALKAERTAISDAAKRGLISEEVAHALIREADNRAVELSTDYDADKA